MDDDKAAFLLEWYGFCGDVFDMRQRRRVVAEGVLELGNGRFRSLHLNKNPAAVIAHKACQAIRIRQPIDKRPEANALHHARYRQPAADTRGGLRRKRQRGIHTAITRNITTFHHLPRIQNSTGSTQRRRSSFLTYQIIFGRVTGNGKMVNGEGGAA